MLKTKERLTKGWLNPRTKMGSLKQQGGPVSGLEIFWGCNLRHTARLQIFKSINITLSGLNGNPTTKHEKELFWLKSQVQKRPKFSSELALHAQVRPQNVRTLLPKYRVHIQRAVVKPGFFCSKSQSSKVFTQTNKTATEVNEEVSQGGSLANSLWSTMRGVGAALGGGGASGAEPPTSTWLFLSV